jgi:hypothetical protein
LRAALQRGPLRRWFPDLKTCAAASLAGSSGSRPGWASQQHITGINPWDKKNSLAQ